MGDEGSEYQREVVFPGVLRLLSAKPRQRVLDIACGQGALCRLLHEQGARVTGVDAAGPLLDHARQRSDKTIEYLRADARDLAKAFPHGSGQFDAAACVLAIQNIQPIRPVFEGAATCLKERGRLVLVMMHPAFRVPKHSHWGWDEDSQTQYRRVDRYLLPRKEPIVTHPGKDPGQYTWTFHRPLQDYVRALRQSGLLIDTIEEWTSHKLSDSGPRAKAENIARAEIPMFMAMRAIRVPS